MTVFGSIIKTALIVAGGSTAFSHLETTGHPVEPVLQKAGDIVGTASSLTSALHPVLSHQNALSGIDSLIDQANRGVDIAGRLYRTAHLTGDERKDAAGEAIQSALELSGVPITPVLSQVIDGAMESAFLLLHPGTAENGTRLV